MVEARSPKGTAQSIIAHMNKDHKHSLEDYLYVYGNIPITKKVSHVRMKDFDVDHMTLVFQHSDIDFDVEKVIVFDPPLQGLSMAREKLVVMAKEAAAKLNHSHVIINAVAYPQNFIEYLIIFLAFLPFAAYKNRSILMYLPFPAVIVQFLSKDFVLIAVMLFVLVVHGAECIFLLRPKLNFYRVPTDFLVEWYFFGMLEGYGAIRRFNSIAKQKTH